MPDLAPQSIPDLSRVTETTRRELYDAVVRLQFSPVLEDGPESYTGPSYTPDAAGLNVFHVFGRWFAVWTDLDEPELPEDRRVQVLRVSPSTDSPSGLLFEEV